MTLPLPKLDNRTWAELVAEGRAILPRESDGWTDYNFHDPGISVLELYAWLAELLLYRADAIPPAAIRAFLRWVGVTPLPPQAARAVVAVQAAAAVTLGAPVQVWDADPLGGHIFQLDDPLVVSAAWLDLEVPPGGAFRGRVEVEAGGTATDLTAQNAIHRIPWQPFGDRPRPADALRLGFDVPLGLAGSVVRLYVATPTPAADEATRAAIFAEWAAVLDASSRDCRPPAVCGCAEERGADDPADGSGWRRHYSAVTAWEYATTSGWAPLADVVDETFALSLSGGVTFSAPADHVADADGRSWIRCRLAAGGFDCPPTLSFVALNAIEVRHAATPATPLPETLTVSSGGAAQRVQVTAPPVVAGTTRLRVSANGVDDDDWIEVAEWDRSGPDDRHYRLEPESGILAFGDGRTGRVPPSDAAIGALDYRTGGGLAGNVRAGTIHAVRGTTGLGVVQLLDAWGGTDAESLDRAHGRALDILRRPSRAVTTDDAEFLALAVPGLPVARARAVPGYHPAYPCIPMPGALTVVVIPACGAPPYPSAPMLTMVERSLSRRRPLTTNLVVAPPDYTVVSISARLHAVVGTNPGTLTDRARIALDRFLDPLTGGPAETGWPFGRPLLEADVMTLLAHLPGVDYVDEVGFTVTGLDPDAAPTASTTSPHRSGGCGCGCGDSGTPPGGADGSDPGDRCGIVTICPIGLFASGSHRLTVVAPRTTPAVGRPRFVPGDPLDE